MPTVLAPHGCHRRHAQAVIVASSVAAMLAGYYFVAVPRIEHYRNWLRAEERKEEAAEVRRASGRQARGALAGAARRDAIVSRMAEINEGRLRGR